MFEHYGYFHVMLELCNNDYEKLEYWREQSFIYILNCRSHWIDVQEEKLKMLQEANKK